MGSLKFIFEHDAGQIDEIFCSYIVSNICNNFLGYKILRSSLIMTFFIGKIIITIYFKLNTDKTISFNIIKSLLCWLDPPP